MDVTKANPKYQNETENVQSLRKDDSKLDECSSSTVHEVRPFRMKKEKIDVHTTMSIDAEGGTLVIKNTGISLYIPPNALEEEAGISITVVNDTEIQIPPKDNLPIVTPLVKCEPSEIKFREPVTLTLPHCGLLTDDKDQTLISFCGTESGTSFRWDITEDTGATFSKTECKIKLTHFSIHFCSVRNVYAKRMRIFSMQRKARHDFTVHLWICNDDKSVYKTIQKQEERDSFEIVGAWQDFTLYDEMGDIVMTFNDIRKTINFTTIWNGSRARAVFKIPIDSAGIDGTLVVQQRDNKDDSCVTELSVYLKGTRGATPISPWQEVQNLATKVSAGGLSTTASPGASCSESSTARTKELRRLNMTRKPRGKCLVLTYENFKTLRRRKGNKIDMVNLEDIFETTLDFEVAIYADLDYDETMDCIKIAATADHSLFDCFVCFVCSHGDGEAFYTSDDKRISIQEIMTPFNAKNCESLIDKPKIFFINTCLGDKVQTMVSYQKDAGIATDLNKYRPEEADFCLVLSTVPGYASLRDPKKGTVYVQSLQDCLKDNYMKLHLVDLLTMVNDKVNEIFMEIVSQTGHSDKAHCQISTLVHNLNYTIHFCESTEKGSM